MGFFDFFKKKKDEDVFRKISVDELIKPNPLDLEHETPSFQTPYDEEKQINEPTMMHSMPKQMNSPQYTQEHHEIQEKTRQRFQDLGISTQRQENANLQSSQNPANDRMLELLNAKLDAISAKIDALSQKVNTIEREINKRW